jgi:hypothetical protein
MCLSRSSARSGCSHRRYDLHAPKQGGGAVPSLDADALVQAVPALAQVGGLQAHTAEGLGVLISFIGAVRA